MSIYSRLTAKSPNEGATTPPVRPASRDDSPTVPAGRLRNLWNRINHRIQFDPLSVFIAILALVFAVLSGREQGKVLKVQTATLEAIKTSMGNQVTASQGAKTLMENLVSLSESSKTILTTSKDAATATSDTLSRQLKIITAQQADEEARRNLRPRIEILIGNLSPVPLDLVASGKASMTIKLHEMSPVVLMGRLELVFRNVGGIALMEPVISFGSVATQMLRIRFDPERTEPPNMQPYARSKAEYSVPVNFIVPAENGKALIPTISLPVSIYGTNMDIYEISVPIGVQPVQIGPVVPPFPKGK